MSQRLETAIACMTSKLEDALQAVCDKLEAERTLTPIVGDACCVLIDGAPAYAAPVRTFNGEEGTVSETVQWVNPDTLAPITGTVEAAEPCDCPCLECAAAEEGLQVVDATVTGNSATITTSADLSTAGIAAGTAVRFVSAAGEQKATATMVSVSGTKGSTETLQPENANLTGCDVEAVAAKTAGVVTRPAAGVVVRSNRA